KILLDFDVTGGLFNNDQPLQEHISSSVSSSVSLFSYSLSPDSSRIIQGTSVSIHAAVQTNLWRNLFLSASGIRTVRKELFYLYLPKYRCLPTSPGGIPACERTGGFDLYKPKGEDRSLLSNIGLGWKFKPNLIAEYLYSIDHSYVGTRSHSLKLRYTFNLGITGEK